MDQISIACITGSLPKELKTISGSQILGTF
jgi:hypothetical protein